MPVGTERFAAGDETSESLLLTNAKIVALSAGEAPVGDAVVVDGGTIQWCGPGREAPPTARTIDLDGRWLLPGLTDAHSHLLAAAQEQLQVALDGDELRTVQRVADHLRRADAVLPQGEWLGATRLFIDRLEEGRFPTRAELDRAVTDRPLVIRCLGGHAALVNSAALRLLDDDPSAADVMARLSETDRRDGFLAELAADAVFRRQPAPSTERLADGVRQLAGEYLRFGVTAVVEAAVGFTNGFDEEWAVWQRLRAEGPFPLRMGFMLRLDPAEAAGRGLRPGTIDADWQIRTLKFFADGIVGARTAAFHGGYCECPGNVGELLYSAEELRDAFVASHQAGWQVAVHAIGDRAIDDVIAAYDACGAGEARHRIEHFALPSDAHVANARRLGLHIVTQYGFLAVMGDMFASALGHERAQRLYPGRRLLDAGLALAGSSDYPIGPFSPFAGMAGSRDRRSRDGYRVNAGEALSPVEAMRHYVQGGTRVMFHEQIRGAIHPGMAADLLAVDHDPLTAPPEQLTDTEAALTVVRGRVSFNGLRR